MLKILTGKAGSGKTSRIIGSIASAVQAGKENVLYIVPEQYSHEAERELCRVCGDRMSLCAEVLSFTGLARRVSAEVGGSAVKYLDEGGKLLCMTCALDFLNKRPGKLGSFRYAAGSGEAQDALVRAVEELKTSGISAEQLRAAVTDPSLEDEVLLRDKLRDLAEIYEQYDETVQQSGAENRDRLTVTAEQLREHEELRFSEVYIDGFTDFTAGELRVIQALARRRDSDVTVCLTYDGDGGANDAENEAFAVAGMTLLRLKEFAKEQNLELRVETVSGTEDREKAAALALFTKEMFGYAKEKAMPAEDAVRLFACGSISAECELAAAEALRLVREENCRWRDIAVAARGFEDYRPMLRSIFELYGVPLFMTDSESVLTKPVPSLIACAYDVARSGWDCDEVISYMRTGLTGLSREECDELENYIYKWQLKERDWARCGSWKQNPEGYREGLSDSAAAVLERVNASAVTLAAPLMKFIRRDRKSSTAREHAENLATFMRDLHLDRRAAEQLREGSAENAELLKKLWNLTVNALEQCEAILGDTEISMSEFGKLFIRMLSKYTISAIPPSLDRVSAGDFDRMRRRNIKHLIVLGASDSRLPKTEDRGGVFSENERERLRSVQIELSAGEGELWREFSLIYNCLSLPSESLTLSYAAVDAEGNRVKPSFLMKQAERLFGLETQEYDLGRGRLSAREPAMTMAVKAGLHPTAASAAAAAFFRETEAAELERLEQSANRLRGRLSDSAVRTLYGKDIVISASKTDQFANCRFGYFCQYGLKAEPYEPIGFKPPEIGTFVHSIFENTAREVKGLGGFKQVDDGQLREITDRCIEQYVHNELGDFAEKSERFVYLFDRLRDSVYTMVLDAAAELRCSDFEPVDFELNFYRDSDMPRFSLSDGEHSMTLSGIADRVDIMEKDGKKYVRIVDYKTGKKDFRPMDVYNGFNMQMLLYLMALEQNGAARYGGPLTGAGIIYFPARDEIASVYSDDETAIESKKDKNSERKGFVLDDPAVLAGWDTGEEKKYVPLKLGKDGKLAGDALYDAHKVELLKHHVEKSLMNMSKQLGTGNIEAAPFYQSSSKNACANCDFRAACGFADGEFGESIRYCPSVRKKGYAWELLEKEMQDDEQDRTEEGGEGR